MLDWSLSLFWDLFAYLFIYFLNHSFDTLKKWVTAQDYVVYYTQRIYFCVTEASFGSEDEYAMLLTIETQLECGRDSLLRNLLLIKSCLSAV